MALGGNRAYQKVASQSLPNAEGDLIDLGTTASVRFHVWFYMCNESASAQTVTIGLDNASGGTLAAGEYWLKDTVIPANSFLDWMGPFYMDRDDQIRGHDGGAGGNVVSVHFRLEQIW